MQFGKSYAALFQNFGLRRQFAAPGRGDHPRISDPGKLNIGVGGNGTLLHLSTELFKMMAGVNLTNVLYRGDGQALTDLLGGHVDVAFSGSSAIEQIK